MNDKINFLTRSNGVRSQLAHLFAIITIYNYIIELYIK